MGRPPKPTELAKLQGNPGRRAIPDDQPVPPKGDIVPPPRLKGKAREYFIETAKMLAAFRPSLVYPADTQIIARYCECLVDYEDLVAWRADVLRAKSKRGTTGPAIDYGLVYPMRSKAKKGERSQISALAQMPQAREIRELKADLVDLERELGMTPKARSTMRVRAVQKALPDSNTAPTDAAAKPNFWKRSPNVVAKIG